MRTRLTPPAQASTKAEVRTWRWQHEGAAEAAQPRISTSRPKLIYQRPRGKYGTLFLKPSNLIREISTVSRPPSVWQRRHEGLAHLQVSPAAQALTVAQTAVYDSELLRILLRPGWGPQALSQAAEHRLTLAQTTVYDAELLHTLLRPVWGPQALAQAAEHRLTLAQSAVYDSELLSASCHQHAQILVPEAPVEGHQTSSPHVTSSGR